MIKQFISNHQLPTWGSVAFFWIAFAALVGLVSPVSAAFPGLWKGAFLGTLVSVGTILITLGILRKSQWNVKDVGLAFSRSSVPRFILGMGCGLVLITLHFGILWLFGGQVSLERVPEVKLTALLVAVCSFVPLAAMEELGFRGYAFRRLESSYGLGVAQLIVALAFAVYHVVGGFPWIAALLGTGMGSILFGMAAIATRGLAVPIGLHAAWNIGGWTVGEKQIPGLWRIVIEESSRPTSEIVGMIGYFGVLGLATLGFWLLHRWRLREGSYMR